MDDSEVKKAILLQDLALKRHEQVERSFNVHITRAAAVFAFSNFILAPSIAAVVKLPYGWWRVVALTAVLVPYAVMMLWCWQAYGVGLLQSLPDPARLLADFSHYDEAQARLAVVAEIEAAFQANLLVVNVKSRKMRLALRALIAEITMVVLVIGAAALGDGAPKKNHVDVERKGGSSMAYDNDKQEQKDPVTTTTTPPLKPAPSSDAGGVPPPESQSGSSADAKPVSSSNRLPKTLPKPKDYRDLIPATRWDKDKK